MPVNNDRLFKWGVMLMLIYPFLSVILLFFPSVMSPWLFEVVFQVTTFLSMCGLYTGIVGFLMIVVHYFNTTGREEKRYRRLDYMMIVALVALTAGIALIFRAYFVAEPHPYYESFVRYLHLGWFVCLGACVLGWAYGLLRFRIRWVMLCSASAMTLSFLPQIPYNAPEFIETFLMPSENAPDPSASLETTDEQPPLDSAAIQDVEDSVRIKNNRATPSTIYLGDMFLFLFALVYTWMRWGGTLLKNGSSGDGGNPDEIPHHTGGRTYALGETYLLLALPLVIVAAIGLSFLQMQVLLFTYNTAALLEAGLVVVTAGILLLVIPRLGRLSPERLDKTDRRFRQVLFFLLLFPLGGILAIVYERMVGGTLNPYAAVGFASLFHATTQQAFLLAALLLWLWGVQKKHALCAVCGGIVFVSLLGPQVVLSSLYPHVSFSSDVEASGVVDDSVWQESGADLLPDDAETSKSDAARYCERMNMPWGSNPVRLLFFPRYIRMHVTALLLFTLMRFGADVFPKEEASPHEEPALS